MQVMLMRLMSKGEYLIVPKGTKFTGSGKLGLSWDLFSIKKPPFLAERQDVLDRCLLLCVFSEWLFQEPSVHKGRTRGVSLLSCLSWKCQSYSDGGVLNFILVWMRHTKSQKYGLRELTATKFEGFENWFFCLIWGFWNRNLTKF